LSFSMVAVGGTAKSSGSICLPGFAVGSNNFEVTWNSSIQTVQKLPSLQASYQLQPVVSAQVVVTKFNASAEPLQ
jgi:hypothetical protein